MTNTPIKVPGEIAIKTCIADVCLQWSRLEMTIMGLICQIEPMEMEKAYIVFGGLDILPRINMAINLARFNKIPPPIIKRIVAARKSLQDGLMDRRNQVVHGAHKDIEGAETTLTMVRWKGDQRDKRLHATDIALLASDVHELGTQVHQISVDLLNRSIRIHTQVNLDDALA